MALHGSASVNLSPILFKGNNRALGVNVIIHQDQSGSMDDVSLFYSSGEFIGELQKSLLDNDIGTDEKYPNLYSYFGVFSRNPSSPFTITNSGGSLTVSQAFMKGLDDKNSTISYWTNNYFNNSTNHVVNICTNVINSTTGGRLTGYDNSIGGGSPKSEDIHGNIWSIYTTPNAISTGLAGRYGSVLGSEVRRGSTTIVITNSDEQEGAPTQMINTLVAVNFIGSQRRTINGSNGEVIFRKYRIFGVNSYNILDSNGFDYDGLLFYGSSTNLPFGLVKFGANDTYTITRTSNSPSINGTTAISGTELNPPFVSLSSNVNSIPYGGSVTLTWNSAYADNVISSTGFGFSDIIDLSGTLLIENLTQDTTYAITVANPIGAATSSVTVTVGDPAITIPTVNLSSPSETPEGYVYVDVDGSVTLNWTSTNATSVSSFTGTGFNPTTVSGTATISNVTTDSTFTITVQGPGGTTTSNEIRVLVNSPTVNLTYTKSYEESFGIYFTISNGKYLNSKYIFVGGYSRDFFSGGSSLGQRPLIFISNNKQDWEVFTGNDNTTSTFLTDITFGNGIYVAVGTNGKIIVSSDEFFTSQTISISSQTRVDFLSVEYGNNIFIAMGIEYNSTNQEYTLTQYHSTDGTTWTKPNVTYSGLSSPPSSSDLGSLGGGQTIAKQRLTFINGNFYLVSKINGTLYYSSNGLNWSISYTPNPQGPSNISYRAEAISYNGSTYILSASFTNSAIFTSVDGLNWTYRHAYSLSFPSHHIAYIGSNIIKIDSQISTNGGVTWSGATNFIKGISDGTSIISLKNTIVSDNVDSTEVLESFDGTTTSSIFNSIEYEVSSSFDLNDPLRISKFNTVEFTESGLVYPLLGNESVSTVSGRKFYKFIAPTFYGNVSSTYINAYSYTINWSSSNATTVVSTSGDGFSTNLLSGSTTIIDSRTSLLEYYDTSILTKNYSITVQGYNSRRSTSSITVYIEATPSPTAISLSSDKSSVGIGETFNLTWTSTNADTVSSVAGFGFTAGATSGSTLVTAGINSTYSITVQSPSGITTSNTIPITINAPTATLSSDKSTTDLGSPVKLTWNSTNATSVASSTGSNFAPTEASGSAIVYPTTNTTYSVTVEGPGGITTSNTIPVTINAPTVYFASPNNIIVPLNGYLVLNWISTNATSVTSVSGIGFTTTDVSGFAIIQNITEDRTYSISVSGPSGIATASVNVGVNTNSNISVSSQQLHDTITLAAESRGGVFTINNIFTNSGEDPDNRVAFSKCLAAFIEDTI